MITRESTHQTIDKLADPNRGRLVAVGISPDGRSARLFTGMGGRSAGSKNRYYQEVEDLNREPDYVRTAVHDPTIQIGDPSATIYIAQRSRKGWHVS